MRVSLIVWTRQRFLKKDIKSTNNENIDTLDWTLIKLRNLFIESQ